MLVDHWREKVCSGSESAPPALGAGVSFRPHPPVARPSAMARARAGAAENAGEGLAAFAGVRGRCLTGAPRLTKGAAGVWPLVHRAYQESLPIITSFVATSCAPFVRHHPAKVGTARKIASATA